jgi:uroporphyrinogen-III decarboxylase
MHNTPLTQKENALRAILRTGIPEWVPIVDDCMEILFPSPLMEYAPFGQSGKDWFGCEWEWNEQTFSHAPNVRKPPLLDDILEWRDVVQFPDLDSIDWKAAAKKDMAHMDRENKLVRLFCTQGPFERVNTIMGMEGAFIAMMEEPEEYKALIESVTDYKVHLLDLMLEAYHPDEVFFHDDLGAVNGPLISLEMYREFLKPSHKRIGDTIRRHGAIYTHHSCGNMQIFIDDLLDNGAQMLNPLQPLNNWKEIIEKYGDRVSFNVGAEFNANLTLTKPDTLIADTHHVIDTFAPGKNLLFQCYISNMSCIANKEIMNEEARRYGAGYYK